MHFVKLLILLFSIFISSDLRANDLDHRRVIQSAMMVSVEDNSRIYYPFFSSVDILKENGRFTRSSGWYLIDVQPVASSYYDPKVSFDITKFYESEKKRVRFIINYQLPNTSFFISYGYDSGTKAEKIEISNSIFFGLSQALSIQKRHFLFYSWGHWYGEKIKEKPCLDSYDREYWCPSLIAWKDRPHFASRQETYLDLRYVYVFY